MGSGDKHPHAVGHGQQAALDDVGDNAFHYRTAFLRGNHHIPALEGIDALLGKHDGAFLVVGAHDEQLQLIPYLADILRIDVGVGGQLIQRNISGLLAADDFNLNLIRSDPHNDAAYPFVRIQALQGSFQRLLKAHLLEGFGGLRRRFGRSGNLFRLDLRLDNFAVVDNFRHG